VVISLLLKWKKSNKSDWTMDDFNKWINKSLKLPRVSAHSHTVYSECMVVLKELWDFKEMENDQLRDQIADLKKPDIQVEQGLMGQIRMVKVDGSSFSLKKFMGRSFKLLDDTL